jgi:hypothetical protein
MHCAAILALEVCCAGQSCLFLRLHKGPLLDGALSAAHNAPVISGVWRNDRAHLQCGTFDEHK